jgi:hypothetical protein
MKQEKNSNQENCQFSSVPPTSLDGRKEGAGAPSRALLLGQQEPLARFVFGFDLKLFFGAGINIVPTTIIIKNAGYRFSSVLFVLIGMALPVVRYSYS